MLHGGPGGPWPDHLSAVDRWAHDRPVVLYHQLGCGRSDDPADPSRWTVEAFVEEVGTVREHLGLDQVHVLGWSWGGLLAVAYALTRPAGLHSLTLASPVINIPFWEREGQRLRDELPPDVVRAMRRFEDAYRQGPPRAGKPRSGRTAAQLHRAAAVMRRTVPVLMSAPVQRLAIGASRVAPLRSISHQILSFQFVRRHVMRADPIPADIFTMFGGVNSRLYRAMWGPAEYLCTGSLSGLDLTSRLGELDVPVLVISGAHDEATPSQMHDIVDHIRDCRWEIFEESAHCAILEEPHRFADAVDEFLAEGDGSR
jgi:pimeloyl-ACP methyl ester carboxylesterase